MKKAELPKNEAERLKAVHSLHILDTKPEERFNKITNEAAKKLEVPISAISIIDEEREWYKSCHGLDTTEGPRDISFCGHTLTHEEDILVVEDTLEDERFRDNPYVLGDPFVRFYAGVKLFDKKNKMPIGVFCVKDKSPRSLKMDDLSTILEYAQRAQEEINKANSQTNSTQS